MYRSANLSGILSKIKFIQNGVDEDRRKAVIKINKGNNGASYVRLPENTANESKYDQNLETVLLSDIIEAATITESPKQIVVKIDVELFECRVFLGSSSLFDPPQKVPITAIIMEWVFVSPDGRFSEECPREKVQRMTKMLLYAGYVPINTKDLSKLNYTKFGTDWRANVLWILNTTNSIFRL
jgi:hypothetical protein